MAFIGDVFPENVKEELTGVIVSIKEKFNVIQIWIRDYSDKKLVENVK